MSTGASPRRALLLGKLPSLNQQSGRVIRSVRIGISRREHHAGDLGLCFPPPEHGGPAPIPKPVGLPGPTLGPASGHGGGPRPQG